MAKPKNTLPNLKDIYNNTQPAMRNAFGQGNQPPAPLGANPNQPPGPLGANQNQGTTVPTATTPTLPQNASLYDSAKFLYDTRLQNIFTDYQTSVAQLQQSEQQQLQDAYYIRELSKKYLGEYASNVGIGDVSGNLLDIYSNYQQNVSQIQANSQALALNLENAYNEQTRENFEQALAMQMEAQQIELDQNAQGIMFDITRGNTGGLEWSQYLQSKLDSGEITQEAYNSIYRGVYMTKVAQIEDGISSGTGFFGFKTNEAGERVPMTVTEYIEQNRSWLTDEDYVRLMDASSYGQLGQGEGTFSLVDSDEVPLLDLGYQGLTFKTTIGGKDFYFSSAKDNVDTEGSTVTSDDLFDYFEDNYQGETLISGQSIVTYRGSRYVFVEGTAGGAGNWYRLFNSTSYATPEGFANMQKNWVALMSGNQEVISGLNFTVTSLTGKLDDPTMTLNGQEFVVDKDDWYFRDQVFKGDWGNNFQRLTDLALKTSDLNDEEELYQTEAKAIYDAFKNIHGIDLDSNDARFDPQIKGFKMVMVKVGNDYYVLKNDGDKGAKIYKMKRKV